MSALKWLNKLLIVENLLAIYRGYCNQKMIKKCFIISQVFVLTIFHTGLLIGLVYHLTVNVGYAIPLRLSFGGFAISAFVTAMPPVLTGIIYSQDFQSYLNSTSRVSETLKEDKILLSSLKKLYRLSVILFLFFIAFGVLTSVEVMLRFHKLSELLLGSFVMITQSIWRTTILFEYLMFFVVVMIVYHLTKSLTSLVSVAQERVGCSDLNSDEQCDITKEVVQGWIEMYQDLVNCCDMVMLCFGSQYFYTLFSCVTYYVILIFQACYMNHFRLQQGYTNELYAVGILVSYVSILILSIVAAQKARNQGVKFHRALVRLYNTMIIIDSNEAEVKSIKDFIRLIKKKPIEMKLLSNIPAGMYILPFILTLAVNYLIVMMQFTHIV